MPVGSGEESVAADADHPVTPAARVTSLPLDVCERRLDRPLVRLEQRRRHAWSPIANSTLTHFGAENVRSNAATFVRPRSGLKPLPGPWIEAVHRAHERRPDRPGPRHRRPAAGADPPARRLASAGEVVLDPLRDLLLVVCELIVRSASFPIVSMAADPAAEHPRCTWCVPLWEAGKKVPEGVRPGPRVLAADPWLRPERLIKTRKIR